MAPFKALLMAGGNEKWFYWLIIMIHSHLIYINL
jgi:hypothetical protein